MLLSIIGSFIVIGVGGFAGYATIHFITEANTKKQSWIRFITFLLLLIMLLVVVAINTTTTLKANKDVELETVGITEIYRQYGNNYIITTEDNKIYTIETDTVYKGDSNYIVKKHYPNVAKLSKLWFEFNEYTYSIVVTDTNIQTLPNLTN